MCLDFNFFRRIQGGKYGGEPVKTSCQTQSEPSINLSKMQWGKKKWVFSLHISFVELGMRRRMMMVVVVVALCPS